MTTQLRIHEAPTLPCSGCGAALPADPTASHVWCAMCHAWRSVPDPLRQQAWQVQQATWQAQSAAASHQWAAQAERGRHAAQRRSHLVGLAMLVVWCALIGVSMVFSWIQRLKAGVDDYDMEPWVAAALGVGGAGFGFFLLAAAVANGVAFWKLYTRHARRAARSGDKDWFASGVGHAPAMCGGCGAPIAFRPGEQSLTCGHCRSTVVASQSHGHRLISIAYDATQLAALEKARAERVRVKAELTHRRRVSFLSWFVAFSTCFVVFLPLALVAYTVRTVTRSVEQHMLDVARDLSGDFGSGMPALFDWLDTYWLGEAPHDFTHLRQGMGALFDSRWSISAVFHDRPVLVAAITGATDRSLAPYLLLARPRVRSADALQRAEHSSAARRVREFGFDFELSYPGVVIRGAHRAPAAFDIKTITALAQAAYELAEET